eukprot:Filipodium_phascolosomae@DN2414_c0_g1_i8.p1
MIAISSMSKSISYYWDDFYGYPIENVFAAFEFFDPRAVEDHERTNRSETQHHYENSIRVTPLKNPAQRIHPHESPEPFFDVGADSALRSAEIETVSLTSKS